MDRGDPTGAMMKPKNAFGEKVVRFILLELRQSGKAVVRSRITKWAAVGLAVLAVPATVGSVGAPEARAATGPAWSVHVRPNADNFIPGRYDGAFIIEAENVGEEETNRGEAIVIENAPPAGAIAKESALFNLGLAEANLAGFGTCPTSSKCLYPEGPLSYIMPPLQPGEKLTMMVRLGIPSGLEGELEDTATVSGGGAIASAEGSSTVQSTVNPPFGPLRFGASVSNSSLTPYTQAGGHPYELVTEFNFGSYSSLEADREEPVWLGEGTSPVRDPKEIGVELPPGLLANPQGVPRCSLADYFTEACEIKDAVGDACLRPFSANAPGCRIVTPILNLQPQGNYPAEFGILVADAPFIVVTSNVRSGSDYGANATSISPAADLNRVRLTFWGVPAEESHNKLRGKYCGWAENSFQSVAELEHRCEEEEGNGGGGPAEVEETPFLTMPTECSGNPLTVGGRYNSWQVPSEFAEASVNLPAVDGCNALSFEPKIEARPTTNLADAPSGFELNLQVPQNEDPEGVSTPELKESVIKLPQGLTLNPASAEGLTGCSEAQIGLHSEEPASCPEASKLGSAEVKTQLLHEPLTGSLYLATPHQNPYGSLLAGYIALEGQGVKIKLPGRFETNPQTGQITAKFLENPQLPFEELKLDIFGGARGAFRTPATCGNYETSSVLTPFSAPESGPAAEPSTTFETSAAENGGACPKAAGRRAKRTRAFAPAPNLPRRASTPPSR